ncbi:hypothetical protein IKG13_03060 [Candidatus Saccharibacteria bacterium]|nr:hypothetical protein [Candidatus Saccharibacteria bacterium]MBR3378120.1 hypothetical protein [Candidatus Saccharibacteria bacterium]
MPKSLKAYADKSLALAYRNHQRYVNYYGNGRGQQKRARKPWLPLEDKLILCSPYTDRELSSLLKRTVPAIQKRRCILKKTAE